MRTGQWAGRHLYLYWLLSSLGGSLVELGDLLLLLLLGLCLLGSVARVTVELDTAVPLEVLGRIVLRSGGNTVAAGLLEEVRA